MWYDFFSRIYLISLPERTDRYIASIEEFEKYQIPIEYKKAIKRNNGAEGLLLTTLEILYEAVEKQYERILIFEDDIHFVNDPNITMPKVIEQLPKDWLILYLGCQLTIPLHGFTSPNLIPVIGGYATHAWAISKKGIELILSSSLDAPIDNHIVDHIQKKFNGCYCTYPLLATQRPDMSDIGRTFTDWRPFIDTRFEQRILELKSKGIHPPQS